MPLSPYHLDEARLRVLVALYNNTRAEITRYRDYTWKITAYVVTILGAILALSVNSRFLSLWSEMIRNMFRILVVLFSIAGSVLIWYFNRKFTNHRTTRAELDKLFGFFEMGKFSEGVILKEKVGKENKKVGKENPVYHYLFIGFIALVALVVIVSMQKVSIGP
jgi:glucan phosphoethanolaminetransferase (alkaline phosphatase superfamily)